MDRDRLDKVRGLLGERGLDGVLVTNPANRLYLSGFPEDDIPPRVYAAVLVGPDRQVILTGGPNAPWAETTSPDFEVRPWKGPWEPFAAGVVKDFGIARLGYEDIALSVASHAALAEALGAGVGLVPVGDAIGALRATKDAGEVAALEAAIRLTDEVFVAATADLAPGTTERELAWRLERGLREGGAEGVAFPVIVAAGPHAARPHHTPGDRPIGPGEPVIIDMGARLGGYNGDLTRTVWVGEPDVRLVEVWAVVAEAQRAALAAIRPGVAARDVDAAARAVIRAAGYGDRFIHGLGHGLGIRVHEAPFCGETSDDVLAAGHVTTVEPGIYLPDWGGVRIEDVGVVEDGGFRVLTGAPKSVPTRERSLVR